MLERLVYQSTATHEFGSLHLFNLLTQAQMRNERLQITGHLLFLNSQFTQCIEGPTDSIEQLWQSLQRDERHRNIELIARGPIDQRRFGEWSMAFTTHAYFYVHGLKGFFPIDSSGSSPLVPLCSTAS
jgi:Sensors of blue-light using FAD